eukprot:m.21217 g.21217  ORF g.21217 m.21217 type:complete len:120 (-) comp12353_c0_seq1:34-393(-)
MALLESSLLSQIVFDGNVNYSILETKLDELNRLVAVIAHASEEQLTSNDEKLAFLINAYNIIVLHKVVTWCKKKKSFAQKHLRPLWTKAKFFFIEKHEIMGRRMTLAYLENGIIRCVFR